MQPVSESVVNLSEFVHARPVLHFNYLNNKFMVPYLVNNSIKALTNAEKEVHLK